MSLPPLTPSYCRKIIQNKLSELKSSITRQLETKYSCLINASFQFLEDQLTTSISDSPLAERDIKKIQDQEAVLVFEQLAPIFEERKLPSKINVELHQVTDSYHDLQRHSADILEKGINPFLDEQWAQNFLLYCLQQGEDWAVGYLDPLEEESQTQKLVFKMLFCHFESYPLLLRLLNQQARQADFQEYLKNEVLKENPLPQALNAFFYLSSKNLFHDWTVPILDTFLKSQQAPLAQDFIVKGLQAGLDCYPDLATFIVEKIVEGEEWCLKVLITFFSKSQPEQVLNEVFAFFLSRIPKDSRKISNIISIFLYDRWKSGNTDLYIHFNDKLENAIAEEKLWFEQTAFKFISLQGSGRFLKSLGEDPLYNFKVKLLILEKDDLFRSLMLNPKDYRVGLAKKTSGYFPKTRQILLGIEEEKYDREFGVLTRDIASQIQSFLAPHSIEIIQAPRNADDSPGVKQIPLGDQFVTLWAQDTVHFLGETVAIPNFITDPCSEKDLKKHRQYRMQQLYPQKFSAPDYLTLGISLLDKLNEPLLKLAHKVDKLEHSTHIQSSHVEGGNILSGVFDEGDKAGQPFLIIGQDSVQYTRLILQKELERLYLHLEGGKWVENFEKVPKNSCLSDQELKRVFSSDFGVSPENIFFVEQPFSFHLDTRMALVGGNRVLLNDSLKALEKSLEVFDKGSKIDSRLLKELKQRAEDIDKYESLVQKQLEDQGFEVIRVPGAFTNYYKREPELHQANFFNFISMESPSESKKNIIVALGAPPKLEEEFKGFVRTCFKRSVDEIYFLNRIFSQKLLSLDGGVRCISQRLEKPLA